MAIRGVTLMPSTITKSLVCVNETENHDMSGIFYNPYMSGPVRFKSLFELVMVMERFFDGIAFPQSSYKDRTFNSVQKPAALGEKTESEVRQYMPEDIFDTESGKKATFVVQVQFRQNATWQGTITWTDERKTQRFRSMLEMFKLMDNALNYDNGEPLLSEAFWKNA